MFDRLVLWLGQGLGAGRFPFGPGTVGSLVGFAWFALLLSGGSFLIYVIGCVAGLAISIWACAHSERILKTHDPSSVVVDEIVAVPFCYFSPIITDVLVSGRFPAVFQFFSAEDGFTTIAVFVLFRVFDIAKPWPVSAAQRLPGGWGVTADDFLAAGYVNVVLFVGQWFGLI